jgi:hypothetical protein
MKNGAPNPIKKGCAAGAGQLVPMDNLAARVKKNGRGAALDQMKGLSLAVMTMRPNINPTCQDDQHLVYGFIRSLVQADSRPFQGASLGLLFEQSDSIGVHKSGISTQNENVFPLLLEPHTGANASVKSGAQALELRG